MKSNKSIVASLAIKISIILLVSFVIGLFFLDDWMALAKGLALGGIFTILKVQLMQTTFKKAITKKGKNAQNYASLHYSIRYFLTLIVLAIGALEPSINIFGVIIGVLSLKVAAYWEAYKEKPTPKDGSVEFVEWEEDDEEGKDF